MGNSRCPNIDYFCLVCGHMVPTSVQRKRSTPEFKLAYASYFDEVDPSGQDYTPNTVCGTCYFRLLDWYHRRGRNLSFMKPMVWIKDPNSHDKSRCYSCINYSPKLNKHMLKCKTYVAAYTGILPVSMPDGVKPPKPPSPDVMSTRSSTTTFTNQSDFQDADYEPDIDDDKPKPLVQNEMDYVVAKMGLSQRNAEFLTSFLKRRKLTEHTVSASSYRSRQTEFQTFYTVDAANTFTHCIDIEGLVNRLGMAYAADDWRLFIDGSVSSLKAVLLHKTNNKPSIPLAYGTNMKECYETLGNILEKIKYEEHKWKICCDLKVVNIMQGIISKGGFPSFFCFICDWDSRYPGNQYKRTNWSARDAENVKQLKLKNEPFIRETSDILLPPLHIKLGIASKFIKTAVGSSDEVFDCLKTIFPKLSDAKIKAGVLNGPDIRKLMKNDTFTAVLTNVNFNLRNAWDALKAVIQNVLGKDRAEPDKAKKLVATMLQYFENINVSMTLKLHFLHHHIDVFLKQLPTESDEQGERFHQVTMPMEKRFKGKKLDAMLAEVCWWSHKVCLYEDGDMEDPGDTGFRDVPLDPLSSCSSAESDHDLEPPPKIFKP